MKVATPDNVVLFQLELKLSTNPDLNNSCACCSKLAFIRRFSSILSSRDYQNNYQYCLSNFIYDPQLRCCPLLTLYANTAITVIK